MERVPFPKGHNPQEDIAVMFRQSELQRRQSRMKIIENHMKLHNESLAGEEKLIHAQAIQNLVNAQLALEKETTPSYFKRLWYALLGR